MVKAMTFDNAFSYITAVKQAFEDEPAKYGEFMNLLNDYRFHRLDNGSLIAKVEELMKDHQNLIPAFSVFYPTAEPTVIPEANTTVIPEPGPEPTVVPKAKRIIRLKTKKTTPTDDNTAVGRRISPEELTFDDGMSHIAAVKETFHDEPGKFREFMNILNEYRAHRVDANSLIANVEKLKKDHQNLLPGFNVFLSAHTKIAIPVEAIRIIPPEANRTMAFEANKTILPESETTIPPNANRTILPKANRTISLEAETTILPEANITISHEVNRTIPPEAETTILPEANITISPEANKTISSEANKIIAPVAKTTIPAVAKGTIIIKDRVIIIPKGKRSIPREVEHHVAESSDTKRTRMEEKYLKFMNKLKTRFRTLDTHKVESFNKIMIKFREGKMSEKELHDEVVDLLYYHEDLIEEFSSFLKQKYRICCF